MGACEVKDGWSADVFVFGLTLVFLIHSPDSHPIRETGERDRVARGTEGQRKRADSLPLSRNSRRFAWTSYSWCSQTVRMHTCAP